VIAGRPVDAGDVVVCDRTGVVVVPRARAAEAASLDRVLQLKAEQAERVAAGRVLLDAIRELLASDRVREIE
jgi:4-hydroxy-4-methyl-2-oxoglutarate aldolase